MGRMLLVGRLGELRLLDPYFEEEGGLDLLVVPQRTRFLYAARDAFAGSHDAADVAG